MNRRLPLLAAGSLLTAALAFAVLISGLVPLDQAVSDQQSDAAIEVRVQARQTQSGGVEVRAQSNAAGGDWTTHTPESRFLPTEPEAGRWYSSSSFAVGAPAAAPDLTDPAVYTQFFVEQAISRYEREGRAAAIAHYNAPESADGQWYVFIIDEDEVVVAHQNPAVRGQSADDVNGPDGYPAGKMVVAAASAEGGWVDYQFQNLALGLTQIKHSWVVRHDGLIFGSGWYEDGPSREHEPGAYTQSFVRRALEMHRVLGRDAVLEYYNSPDSADGDWYMFIHSADGTRLAHAYRGEGWLGTNIGDSGVDVTGYNYGPDTLAIETSGWISYVFVNPQDENQYQRKHSWIIRHDGLMFGSGWYDRNYDLAARNPAGYARLLVQEAMDRYDADGREAALAHHDSPDSVDGEWYVFIIHPDGTRLAHPFLPAGQSILDGGPDPTGYNFRAAIVAVEDREWVSYVFINPDTDEQGQKHTWVVKHDGLLFAAGWYEPGAYEAPGP